jgi:hypothetical protein
MPLALNVLFVKRIVGFGIPSEQPYGCLGSKNTSERWNIGENLNFQHYRSC